MRSQIRKPPHATTLAAASATVPHGFVLKRAPSSGSGALQTDAYRGEASVGTLLSLLAAGRLVARVPTGRRRRWSAARVATYLESVVAGFPTPELYLSLERDGQLEIVDGHQRLNALQRSLDGMSGRSDGLTSLPAGTVSDDAARLRRALTPVVVLVGATSESKAIYDERLNS